MEVCGACGYTYKEQSDFPVLSKEYENAETENEEFAKLLVGKYVSSAIDAEEQELACRSGRYRYEVDLVVCPNCGTVKMSGLNKEEQCESSEDDSDKVVAELEEVEVLKDFLGVCRNQSYIIKARNEKDARTKFLVAMSKVHNLVTCDEIECIHLSRLQVID